MIEHRQLRAFISVAQEGHFGRAAERLFITQPALSALIKKLETDLQIRLFNRYKRATVTLTAAGELFKAEAHLALAQLDRVERIGRMAARGEAGLVNVGYVGSAVTAGVLTDVLRRFREQRPQVRVLVSSQGTPGQIDSVMDGTLDVGLIRVRSDYPAGLAVKVVHSEPLVVALADTHPGATATLTPAMLRDDLFIATHFSEVGGFASNLQEIGIAGGFQPKLNQSVADFMTALCLVGAGYGVVVIPKSMTAFAPSGVIFKELSGYSAEVQLSMISRKNESTPCVRDFLKIAVEK